MIFSFLLLALLGLASVAEPGEDVRVFTVTGDDDRVFHGEGRRTHEDSHMPVPPVVIPTDGGPGEGSSDVAIMEKEDVPCAQIMAGGYEDPEEACEFDMLCEWKDGTCVEAEHTHLEPDTTGFSADCSGMDMTACEQNPNPDCVWDEDVSACKRIEDEAGAQAGVVMADPAMGTHNGFEGYTDEEGNMGPDGYWASNFGYATDEFGFQHPAGRGNNQRYSDPEEASKRPAGAVAEGYSRTGLAFTPTEEDNSHVKGFRGEVGYRYAGPGENPYAGMSLEQSFEDPAYGYIDLDLSCWTVLWGGDYWWSENVWASVYLVGKCYVKFWVSGCGFGFDGGAGLKVQNYEFPEFAYWVWEGPSFRSGSTWLQIKYCYPSEWALSLCLVIKATRYYATSCETWGFKWWNVEFQVKISAAGVYRSEVSGTFWSSLIALWG